MMIRQSYRTRKFFAAVHFDKAGKGGIVFLPKGATLRVIGSSSWLGGSYEVLFERQVYNIFKVDLLAWSTAVFEPIRAKGRAMGACA